MSTPDSPWNRRCGSDLGRDRFDVESGGPPGRGRAVRPSLQSRDQARAHDEPLPPAAALDAAVDWLIRRDAGFAPGEAEEFGRWFAADPAHARALAEAEATFARLQQPRAAGRGSAALRELAMRARRRQVRRRRTTAIAAVGLAMAAAVVIALRPMFQQETFTPAPSVTAARTVEIRPDLQALPDGSTVQLNADAEVRVEFTPTRRGVRLLRGEAHFVVAKDPARPFVVMAEDVEVRAVGTEFAVRRSSNEIDVLVTEGRVAVERAVAVQRVDEPPAPAEPVPVDAGARAIIAVDVAAPKAPAVTRVSTAEIEVALAWREKRIEFAGTPLSEAVELFNRQNRLQLSLGDASVGTLRISGICWADNPASFARLLELSLPVRAEHAGGRIVIRAVK